MQSKTIPYRFHPPRWCKRLSPSSPWYFYGWYSGSTSWESSCRRQRSIPRWLERVSQASRLDPISEWNSFSSKGDRCKENRQVLAEREKFALNDGRNNLRNRDVAISSFSQPHAEGHLPSRRVWWKDLDTSPKSPRRPDLDQIIAKSSIIKRIRIKINHLAKYQGLSDLTWSQAKLRESTTDSNFMMVCWCTVMLANVKKICLQ